MSDTMRVDYLKPLKIFDADGYELSLHTRMTETGMDVIINRSCESCDYFAVIGNGVEICKKCKYEKNWLQKGLR